MRKIPVSNSALQVVANLRAMDARLADPSIADWRIDAAYRTYSVSEDYGDETKVFHWLPDDTEEQQWDYVQHVQISDMWRDIRDLTRVCADLRSQVKSANRRVSELEELLGIPGP